MEWKLSAEGRSAAELEAKAVSKAPEQPKRPWPSITDYNVVGQASPFSFKSTARLGDGCKFYSVTRVALLLRPWQESHWPDFWPIKRAALESGGR